ncbi:MAG: hypothetical protein ACP5JH_10890 [Bacteroidota bacterium]
MLDILGGLIPVIIDAATGAWYYLDQTSINAVLEKTAVSRLWALRLTTKSTTLPLLKENYCARSTALLARELVI